MQFQQLFDVRRNSSIFHDFWLGFGSVLSTGVFSDKISLAALFTSTFRFFKHFSVDTRRLRYLPTFNCPWFFALPPFVHQTFANAKTAPRVIILPSWPIVKRFSLPLRSYSRAPNWRKHELLYAEADPGEIENR